MEHKDATIRMLEQIQETLTLQREDLAGVRSELHAMRVEHGERLERMERHAVATNETLGLVLERLSFFERAATAKTDGRALLDDRVDRLDAEVGRLRERLNAIERGG